MSALLSPARQFFEACETGREWEGCRSDCHPSASFAAQSGAIASISTLEGYCEWMKNLLTPVPDGHYELKFFAADESTRALSLRSPSSTERRRASAAPCHPRGRRLRQITSIT